MTAYDEIMALLYITPGEPTIIVGWEKWTELKQDERTMHKLAVVGDRLFFQGVRIDPFQNVPPEHLALG